MKETLIQDPSPFGEPRAGSNLPEYTVSDISHAVKKAVEGSFGRVRVRGEIGSCRLHSSGHLYLSLKDEKAVLEAVCWRGQVSKLGLRPETGMEVICTGKVTTYAVQSKYQLQIEQMELAGQGALLKLLDDRRKKLAAEGLFDSARKRKLPFLPELIGIVTSPTGAVIRDILHRLRDRFPRDVLLWPVPVQGEGAAEKIAAAIEGFNAFDRRPDLLIVARGGGSLEDLMPFNEEIVVRSVAASRIPVISAVGHETDTTLIDYAADVRAPTPTAAAEMAVPVRAELLATLAQTQARLAGAFARNLGARREKLFLLARALGDPARALAPLMQRLDERVERFERARDMFFKNAYTRALRFAERLRHPRDHVRLAAQRFESLSDRFRLSGRDRILRTEKKLEKLSSLLEALSPVSVLGRGYGLVYDAAGKLVTRAAMLKKGDKIDVRLQDGTRGAVIEK